MPERLWFLIAGALVEVRPELRSETTPLTLNVADPWELAERCWDAGFVLEVDTAVTGEPVVSVIGPFGRRIRLAPRVAATRPRGEM